MATGRGYHEIAPLFPGHSEGFPYGVSSDKQLPVLKSLGWNPCVTLNWYHAYPAIVRVASLNFLGKLHSVYWDGENLYDPSTLKKHDFDSACIAFATSIVNLKHSPELIDRILSERMEYQEGME
jgi:hypothetical protein